MPDFHIHRTNTSSYSASATYVHDGVSLDVALVQEQGTEVGKKITVYSQVQLQLMEELVF